MAVNSNTSKDASLATIEVNALGQIEHLAVPPGWVEMEVQRLPMQLWSLREFHAPEKPDVKLYVYYRGHPVSEDSGESFEGLLEKPPHELDDAEWWSVQEVLRDAALEVVFERKRARTADWAGKRVLIVDGHWVREDEDSFSILINAADHGCHVQEILFVAPASEYQHYLPDVLLALNAIKWKAASEEGEGLHDAAQNADGATPADMWYRIDETLEWNINSEFGLDHGQRLSEAQLRTLERVTHIEPHVLDYDTEGNLALHLSESSQDASGDLPAGEGAENENVRNKKFRTTLETLIHRYKPEDLEGGDE